VSSAGIKGNSVPLTLWHTTVTYTVVDVPPPYKRTWTVSEEIYFRADIHKYREKAGGDLKYRAQPIYFRAAPPSHCDGKVVWSPMPPYISLSPTSGTLPYGFHSNNTRFGSGFVFEGAITPDSRQAAIGWMVYGTVTQFIAPHAPTTTIAMPLDHTYIGQAQPVGSDGFGRYTHPAAGTFGADWNLANGDIMGVTTATLNDHLKWTGASVRHAPNPDNGEDDDS
jgi:hypothetical protein